MRKAMIVAAVIAAITLALVFSRTAGKEPKNQGEPDRAVTHAQETWIRALEWCESRGLKEAVNPEDLDGTPSYYSWQFKPETFLGYAVKYGILPEETTLDEAKGIMKDYGKQREVVDGMIGDPDVKWEREFPGCLKKIGRPPKY